MYIVISTHTASTLRSEFIINKSAFEQHSRFEYVNYQPPGNGKLLNGHNVNTNQCHKIIKAIKTNPFMSYSPTCGHTNVLKALKLKLTTNPFMTYVW